MINVIITVLVVAVLLLIGEYLRRVRLLPGEVTRKFVHITVGSFVAFWPFFLSWRQIEFLSAAFVISVMISQYFNIFRAIHSVQRPTWGELFFALAVGGVALITHDKWIYMAAVLQMSLADGLAAIAGTRWGRGHFYRILGHKKSLVGTATFFVTSLLILIIYAHVASYPLAFGQFTLLAATATLIENATGLGFDNLLVPVLVASVLRLLR